MNYYPVTITLITGAALIALFVAATLVDWFDEVSAARRLHRAHRPRVKTYMTESNGDERIVGEVVSVPHIPRSALIRDIETGRA